MTDAGVSRLSCLTFDMTVAKRPVTLLRGTRDHDEIDEHYTSALLSSLVAET